MDLGVELPSQRHEDVLIAKHATLKVDHVGGVTVEPTEREREREREVVITFSCTPCTYLSI